MSRLPRRMNPPSPPGQALFCRSDHVPQEAEDLLVVPGAEAPPAPEAQMLLPAVPPVEGTMSRLTCFRCRVLRWHHPGERRTGCWCRCCWKKR